ncbi:hypothetical protein NM208_g1752 [Fusarium decemcellulare]|uniref:Uncharacterized protein n=1 Tax=Fusarium decemcellulare TaxID=57161 RepID=A0ACC1SV21_9HYPO|nr:hypothetical protein NM208_g1752 [Fusarium decemcellulare]
MRSKRQFLSGIGASEEIPDTFALGALSPDERIPSTAHVCPSTRCRASSDPNLSPPNSPDGAEHVPNIDTITSMKLMESRNKIHIASAVALQDMAFRAALFWFSQTSGDKEHAVFGDAVTNMAALAALSADLH